MFLFGLLSDLPRILRKVAHDRAEAIIILPAYPTPALQSQLALLPVTKSIQLHGDHSWLVKPTSAVPPEVKRNGWVVPLQACKITWRT